MGGDYGPAVVVEAAVARSRDSGVDVVRDHTRFGVLIDAGANIDAKRWHLLQFAVMGHVYARDILGYDNPRVGLLSVGEEEGKGTELTREAYDHLKGSSLNFAGNV